MQCNHCQYKESRVLESRPAEGGESIRRRRECLNCKHRFTTYERIEFIPIIVLKKDGTKELFDRSKVLRGMVRACEKTGVFHSRLERLVEEIEGYLQQKPDKEVTSKEIGRFVLAQLKKESEVAYVRFASVYGQFQGVKDFVEALDELQTALETREDQWTTTVLEGSSSF